MLVVPTIGQTFAVAAMMKSDFGCLGGDRVGGSGQVGELKMGSFEVKVDARWLQRERSLVKVTRFSLGYLPNKIVAVLKPLTASALLIGRPMAAH